MDDEYEVIFEKLSMKDFLPTGEQWCPDCHVKCIHKDGYFECPECNWSISDEEVEYGDGYPTLESTEYRDYYG